MSPRLRRVPPLYRELADLSPRTFVEEEILLGALGMREIFVGYDFASGRSTGTIALRNRSGSSPGSGPYDRADQRGRMCVQQSGIVQGIQQGHVEAAALLGRLYSLTGTWSKAIVKAANWDSRPRMCKRAMN